MPVNITGADVWTDPIVAPADSDPLNREYVVSIAQGAADRTQYLKNIVDPIETIVDPTRGRGTYLNAIQGSAGWDSIDDMPGWNAGINGAAAQGSGKAPFHWSFMGGGNLPSACTITSIRVGLKPIVDRPTEADRMKVSVYRVPLTFTSVLVADEYDAGGNAFQIVEISGLSIVLTNDDSGSYGVPNVGLIVRVDPGTGATNDGVYFCEARYTTEIL